MKIRPANRLNHVTEYYFSKKLAEIRKLNEEGNDIINMGIGNPDLPTNPDIIEALNAASREEKSHYYQPYSGTQDLRNAFQSWYNNIYNVKLNASNEILPLAGSKEGIMLITLAFINPGDTILIPNPGYPAYASVAELLGAKVVHYNLLKSNNWLPDFDELEQLVSENVKMMWVNYPHMPTGAAASENLFKELVEFGLKNNILICNDNPYSMILNDNPQSILSIEGSKDTCLELNSLSKSHNMQGFRLGTVVGHSDLIQSLLTVKSNYDSGMYLPVQKAAIAALQIDSFWYKKNNKTYRARKENLSSILDQLGISHDKDSQGMFVWAEIPNSFKDGFEYSDHLLYKYGVFAAPGSIFGSNGDKYIRFTLCIDDKGLEKTSNRIKNLKKIAV